MTDRVAIVGGGWAGMAAAVTLACAARPVTVFEAAQVLGGRAERELFDRRRLHLEEPGVFRFKTPALPAPWHLGVALLAMRGLPRQDRLATLAFVRRLRRARFGCAPQLTVGALL